jgi:uracil phosphoribosyltransferase
MDTAGIQGNPALEDLDALNILSHPVVAVRVSELRSKQTSAKRFRELIAEITTSLGMEASR